MTKVPVARCARKYGNASRDRDKKRGGSETGRVKEGRVTNSEENE